MTDVKINGLIIDMDDNVTEFPTMFRPKVRILFGTLFVVLGIVMTIVTYKYIFPTGSIMLMLSGLMLIFWERWDNMIRSYYEKKIIGEEIKK